MTHSPQHLDRLRLRHLRLLDLIAHRGSLRAVGGVLNLTQPAVSQMLKDLEFAFGAELVDRSVRGVSLTRAGQLALQRARSGLATFDHLAGELHAGQPTLLRVGINPAIMYQMLPEALGRLGVAHGDVHFRIRGGMVGEMMQALWDGLLDCYIGRMDWDSVPASMSDALRYEPLALTELVLACAATHPLAGRGGIAVAELLDWSWALQHEGTNNRTALEAGFRNNGLPAPVPVVELAADPNALITLAAKAKLLICLPLSALAPHVAAGTHTVLDVPGLHLDRIQIGFVTLVENEHLPALVALRDALTAA